MIVRMFFAIALFSVAILSPRACRADMVLGGTAQFNFNNNSILFSGGSGPFILDRWYGTNVETATGADLLAGIGGDPIIVPGSGLVTLGANVNGLAVSNPGGRARQTTSLDVDFANVLSTWGAGERIGIDAVLRTVVTPGFGGGVIGIGDYSLENNSGVLTLFNNLQFKASAFTLGAPIFIDNGNGFSVSGSLLVANDLSGLTGGFVPTGTNVGSFSMSVTAVPEPSSLALLDVASIGMTLYRRRKATNNAIE